jgi:carbon storage regulator CsrA
LGIEAPSSVPVHRKEVYEVIQRSNQQALMKQPLPLPKLAGAPKVAPKTNLPKP